MSPTASHSIPTRCVIAASVLAMGFVVTAAALALRPIGAAVGVPSATTVGPSASTSSIVTTQPLLQGSPAPGANETTTTVGRTTGPDNSNKTTRSTNYKVWGIVAALIAVAVIVGVLTWLYWQRTRPGSSRPSPQDWDPEFRERAAAAVRAPEVPTASAAGSVESARPKAAASASGDDRHPRDSEDARPGRDTRDRTDELPIAGDDNDAEAAKPAEPEKAAPEPEVEDDRRAGGEVTDKRGSGGEVAGERGSGGEVADERQQLSEVAEERGPGGFADRVRRRSRFADIVITVPHPDDLRSEPS